jgi:hypothetical protein
MLLTKSAMKLSISATVLQNIGAVKNRHMFKNKLLVKKYNASHVKS